MRWRTKLYVGAPRRFGDRATRLVHCGVGAVRARGLRLAKDDSLRLRYLARRCSAEMGRHVEHRETPLCHWLKHFLAHPAELRNALACAISLLRIP